MIKEIRELYLKLIPWTFLKFKTVLWFTFFSGIALKVLSLFIDNFAIYEKVIRSSSKMQFTWEVLFSSLIFVLATIIAFITSFFGSYYITKKYLKWEPNEEVEMSEVLKIIWVVAVSGVSFLIFKNPLITFICTYGTFLFINKDEVKETFKDFWRLFIPMITWAILALLAFLGLAILATIIYKITGVFAIFVLTVFASAVLIFKSFINFYFSLIYKIEDEDKQSSLIYYKIAKKALNWKITLKYVIITLGLYLPWIILLFMANVFSDINHQIWLFLGLMFFLFFAYYIEFVTVTFYQKYLKNNK